MYVYTYAYSSTCHKYWSFGGYYSFRSVFRPMWNAQPHCTRHFGADAANQESVLDISSAQGRSSFNVNLQDLMNEIAHSPMERPEIAESMFFCLLSHGSIHQKSYLPYTYTIWQHWVWTSSDSLQKRNFSLKWSIMGVVIGCPNLATKMLPYFPPNLDVPKKNTTVVFFQHKVEKKTVNKCQHTAPNTVSTRDTILPGRVW